MSDPTYRIDVEHEPNDHMPWKAHIVRLSDDAHLYTKVWDTPDEAVNRASQWIAAQNAKQDGFSLLVGDDGRPVAGHSVKA